MRERIGSVFGIVLLLVVACGGDSAPGGGGQKITDEQLCKFRYGETTPTVVLEAFGEPTLRDDVNGTLLMYEYGDPPDADWVQTTFTFGGPDKLLVNVDRTQAGNTYGPVPSCLEE